MCVCRGAAAGGSRLDRSAKFNCIHGGQRFIPTDGIRIANWTDAFRGLSTVSVLSGVKYTLTGVFAGARASKDITTVARQKFDESLFSAWI